MRRDSGLPSGTWGESGKAPGRCGSQKRKKGPKALFSSTQAETWIMFGAGNETCTRTVSRCFPITFFAEVASEDLNCSLVFCPRQQDRPKKSTDVHRLALSTQDTRSVRHQPRRARTGHVPFSAPTSPPRCRQGRCSWCCGAGRMPPWKGAHRTSRRPSSQATSKERTP